MFRTWLIVSAAAAAGGAEPKGLEAEVAAAFERSKAPGAMVRIDRPGHEPLVLAFGAADAQSGRAMTPDCHFRIASVSKVFVGTAVLTLLDDGKLSLDDPISKYVEGVPNGDRVTLRHLGSHRSGLFNHIESRQVKDSFAAEPARWRTEDELLAPTLRAPTYFEPGAGHHYANANTLLLAKAVEKVTGRPWRDAVRERVIEPLGLSETAIPTDNSLPEPFARGYALGGEKGPFFVRGDVRHDVTDTSPSWWGPAGSMTSTLGDLAKAAKPLATGALLGEKGKAALHDWTKADQPGYEYGFHIERVRGKVGHDGDVPGYQALMYYLPEHDATVAGMANLYGWSVRGMPANGIAKAAADRLFPEPD